MQIFLTTVQVILSILIVVLVILQPSKTGASPLTFSSTDTYFSSKNKGRTAEAMLIKLTWTSSMAWFVVMIVSLMLNK